MVILGFLVLTLNAQEKVVDRIEGIVDNEIILLSDIQNQLELLRAQGPVEEETTCRILDNMLTSKLLVAQAYKDSIIVSPEEVEDELNRKINYYIGLIGSKEKFESYYEKSVDQIKDDFRADIKDQLLSARMRDQIISDVEVTPSEVRSFFNQIPKDSLPYFNKEMEMSEVIVYAKVSEEQEKAALEKITGFKERLENGESFELLASLYSEDPGSASQGGELGEMGRGALVPEFETAAFSLKPGEISDIVKTQFGYHIIQMIERRGEVINVRHILVTAKSTNNDLLSAKNKIDSIRFKIQQDSLTFFDAVKDFSEDEFSKNNGGIILNPQTGGTILEAGEIEPALFFVVDTMDVGGISSPVTYRSQDGKTGYRIVRLDSKSEPHVANLEDDYDKIYNVARNDKQAKVLQNWIKKKARKTYIRVEDDYLSCKYIKAWLN